MEHACTWSPLLRPRWSCPADSLAGRRPRCAKHRAPADPRHRRWAGFVDLGAPPPSTPASARPAALDTAFCSPLLLQPMGLRCRVVPMWGMARLGVAAAMRTTRGGAARGGWGGRGDGD
jgi:hypothetical protein